MNIVNVICQRDVHCSDTLGGVLTALTVLYVFGYTMGAISGAFRLAKKLYEEQPIDSSPEGGQ